MASLLDEIREEAIRDALAAPASKRQTPEREPEMARTWVSGGYVAKVRILCCSGCGAETPILDGVAHEERGFASGIRRLTFLSRGWQVPPGGRREVSREAVRYCGWCIDGLFPQEVAASEAPRAFLTGDTPDSPLPRGLEQSHG
jgi:hypothetical protein